MMLRVPQVEPEASLPTVESESESESSSESESELISRSTPCDTPPVRPPSAQWLPRLPVDEMLKLLRSDREQLPALIESIDEQVGDARKTSLRPIDLRRVEILNRLLEVLSEQSPSQIGVLQSTIVSMLTTTHFYHLPVALYLPEEINEGCCCGPSQSIFEAVEFGVDDRLVVTAETFDIIMGNVPNVELARLLDSYTDYVQAMEVAWQVTAVEKTCDAGPRIKAASGIAVWGDHMYVADSAQHMIFRVHLVTDEITPFCGMRGKAGPHDGPREMAKFNSPSGLAICESTSTLYVCDTGNDAIRAVSIPSGLVQTVPSNPVDPDTRLESPVGICIVRGEYEYDKEGSDDDDDDDDGDANTINSDAFQDFDDEDDDDGIGRHGPLLEGITEEDEDLGIDSRRESAQNAFFPGVGRQTNARYALGGDDGGAGAAANLGGKTLSLVGGLTLNQRVGLGGGHSRRTSGYFSSHSSRRTSGYVSSLASRRASGFNSIGSSLSSRRTSTHFSMTPGESAKDSLRECTEEDDEQGFSLAVTGDHCVYLIKPEKGELVVLAGSPTEYGYKDHDKGKDARFSSLKGIACIRNSLFVADHWNNAIRCINLRTRQVDSVIDFSPCGPIALTLSMSGSVYVLDSECISVCNILKICSLQRTTRSDEGALGTTMFQMIQDSIGSRRGSIENGDYMENLRGRGSARNSLRRMSVDSDGGAGGSGGGSRRGSVEDMTRRLSSGWFGDRRASRDEPRGAGSIAALGPRMGGPQGPTHLFPPMAKQPGKRPSRHSFSQRLSSVSAEGAHSALPIVPQALRSLVPGASLHPALIQMTLRSRGESEGSARMSALTGSQFHVSVVSSVPDDEGFDEGPEFFSFLNPKHETPWKKIPIGTLQYVYQEASGQCSTNTPLTLGYWESNETGKGAEKHDRGAQLMIGSSEWPSILKVLPPRKATPHETGRFRAVAVDMDRVVMADRDSNQIFVVNHTKRTKDKIAGCGKAGYLDGPLDVCRMNQPSSVALDPTTHYIYVADSGNHRIRCIDLSTGFMRTVCGNGVKGNLDGNEIRVQSLDSPFDLHFMQPCHLLISCADNSIRRLDLKTSQLETVLVGS